MRYSAVFCLKLKVLIFSYIKSVVSWFLVLFYFYLKPQTNIKLCLEGSDIKGYVSKHKECKKMFEAQLKSYMKEEGSTLSSMKNMFCKHFYLKLK